MGSACCTLDVMSTSFSVMNKFQETYGRIASLNILTDRLFDLCDEKKHARLA